MQDARVLFVGIGSTTEQFAQYLPARSDLTVVTPSLPIASLLGTRPLDVVTLGGSGAARRAHLRRTDRHRHVGPLRLTRR